MTHDGLTLPAQPLRPIAVPSHRPWAGSRLGRGVGELWLAGPDSVVELEDGQRMSLDRLATVLGAWLVGDRALALLGARFPLLVKVIDAADWLSLQVHPSDAVAHELQGENSVGKAEAWVVLAADPGARLITGPRRGLAEADLRTAISAGTLGRPDCEEHEGHPGDAWLIPAGTIHSIGAGLLVYEIEQPSDLTYRISDWGRPPTPGRRLHTQEALRAVVPGSHAVAAGTAFQLEDGVLSVPQFRLEIVTGRGVRRRPAGRSLEIVTAIGGSVAIAGNGWQETLEHHQALVVPAAVDGYSITSTGAAQANGALADGALAFVGSVP